MKKIEVVDIPVIKDYLNIFLETNNPTLEMSSVLLLGRGDNRYEIKNNCLLLIKIIRLEKQLLITPISKNRNFDDERNIILECLNDGYKIISSKENFYKYNIQNVKMKQCIGQEYIFSSEETLPLVGKKFAKIRYENNVFQKLLNDNKIIFETKQSLDEEFIKELDTVCSFWDNKKKEQKWKADRYYKKIMYYFGTKHLSDYKINCYRKNDGELFLFSITEKIGDHSVVKLLEYFKYGVDILQDRDFKKISHYQDFLSWKHLGNFFITSGSAIGTKIKNAKNSLKPSKIDALYKFYFEIEGNNLWT